MSTATELDPGPVEAAKDRSSIKLMNLPLQKKKQKADLSAADSSHTKDTHTLPSQDTVASKKTSPSAPASASASTSSSKSQSSSSSNATTHSSSSSANNSRPKESDNSQAVSFSSSIPTSRSKPDPPSSTHSNIESDSDPTFLPSEDTDPDQQQQQQQQAQSKNQEEQPLDREPQPDHRVGNPPHYESREERQIRIRKQFHQLGKKKTDFLDANALVGFFAEVTPDKNVQRRYADELLQLCHSRKLHRNNIGAETLNQDGSSDHDSMEGDSSSNRSHQGGVGEQENGSEIRHGDEDPSSNPSKQRQVHYDDFEVFLEEKEERLWNLFREIDHNNDNEIHADELQASLAKAGINMSDAELKQFISAMDKDGDGAIDFEEWRDFLVLLPREPTLKEIYHYVQEVVAQVGVDGDVVMPPSDTDYVARYLLAGAIAGAVSRTATAPLDRLKVYLITNSVPALTGPMAQAGLKLIPGFKSSTAVAPMKQRLLWTAITDLYHQGGLKTFFRGNGLNIIKIAPESAIKFYTYETSKAFIVTHLPSLTVHPTLKQQQQQLAASKSHNHVAYVPEIATSGRFLAGGIAGLVSQFSIYPLETIKTRIMSSTGRSQKSHGSSSSSSLATAGSYSSVTALSAAESRKPCIRSVAREMWQRAGLRGFYRGLGPSLVGIFPYAAIDLSVFETLKFGYMRWKAGLHEGDAGSEEKSLERPSVFVLLACGTISGSVGATSVYPLSLVRTRLQAQGTPHHPQTYTSTLDVFRKTFEQDGIRGFYKGMVPTLTKVVPAVSISYVVYEYSKRELGL
ncbi:hypothetical protein BGZ70_002772 [Mortierella alpina]|uniref:EF-hand domain-containing protein n=1 Tax=Mortierella alpina TaxID=64518 RepID=A0A9P6JIF3_MORAP|nr:hypothetical protein BGZ70_002772 [Mortierella alpina]